MLAMSAAVLETTQGEQVALQGVHVNAELIDLVSNVTMTQTYQNMEDVNIEAVYTFPLPLDAVLLDLTVTLGEKVLKGQVVEKKAAEERYEEAITDGDSAIMLQESQPGLFTMNVGNILAGETIVIKFHYGVLHSYQGNSLRFMLPTTIAPRYGDPVQGGLEPHQIPEHTLSSDYGFSLNLVVKGVLINSAINCPSHQVAIKAENEQVVVHMQNEVSAMDRDFILNFDNIKASSSTALVEKDHEGYVALASFHCDFNIEEDTSPRSFKIVVDCSGSMTGDSINQAKKALVKIVESLRDGDFINITKFGSHYDILSDEQLYINESNRQRLAEYIQGIDADMGGTEMGSALTATYKISTNMDMPHDLLLITDGEVWNEAELIQDAKKSHHRLFTIGVGSSVAENIVRELADSTGGACELVTPNESMADKIHQHFKRMFSPRAKDVNIAWSSTPRMSCPKHIQSVYAGDTLHVFGWFDEIPEGYIQLEVTLPDGTQLTDKSIYTPVSQDDGFFLTRMGTASLIRSESSIDDAIKTEMAVEYQLMTPWTNYLVVHERTGDKAEELPEIRTVPQTLAAGWGGTGIVSECCDMSYDVMDYDIEEPVLYSKRSMKKDSFSDRNLDSELLDIPSFLRREEVSDDNEILDFIKHLNDKVTSLGKDNITSLNLQE
ncbi:MAG: VIT and VWA domain-containing protein, partial [Methylococcales bacterium]